MATRKKRYKPKPFESSGVSNDTSANIYHSMLTSPAFMDMTKNQRILYVCMKDRYYGTRKPEADFPEIESFQGAEKFYFNLALAANEYNLYKKTNRKSFYDDIKEIERHGFIKTVSSGRNTHMRSVYRLADDWQTWKPENKS